MKQTCYDIIIFKFRSKLQPYIFYIFCILISPLKLNDYAALMCVCQYTMRPVPTQARQQADYSEGGFVKIAPFFFTTFSVSVSVSIRR